MEHNISRLKDRFLNDNQKTISLNELQKILQETEARIIARISQAESNIQQSLQDLAEATRQSLPQESQAYLQEIKDHIKQVQKEALLILADEMFAGFEEVKEEHTFIKDTLAQIAKEQVNTKLQWEVGLPFLFKISSEKGLNGRLQKVWDNINYWIPQNLKRPKP